MPRKNSMFERNGIWVKTCSRCHETIPIEQFLPPNICRCHECRKADGRERAARNRDRRTAYNRAYRRRPETKVRQSEHKLRRRQEDVQYRIKENASSAIRMALKRQGADIKHGKTQQLLGCSSDEFKRHIESQFVDGMSWDKIGHGPDKIHIDHILPCALFDLSDERHQRACFNYTNLRPMWSQENESKADRLDDGRSAQWMTPEEKRVYLINKGLDHLFGDSQTPLLSYDEWQSYRSRRSKGKAVIREDGKEYESLTAAGKDIGVSHVAIREGIKRSGSVRGYRFRFK